MNVEMKKKVTAFIFFSFDLFSDVKVKSVCATWINRNFITDSNSSHLDPCCSPVSVEVDQSLVSATFQCSCKEINVCPKMCVI